MESEFKYLIDNSKAVSLLRVVKTGCWKCKSFDVSLYIDVFAWFTGGKTENYFGPAVYCNDCETTIMHDGKGPVILYKDGFLEVYYDNSLLVGNTTKIRREIFSQNGGIKENLEQKSRQTIKNKPEKKEKVVYEYEAIVAF